MSTKLKTINIKGKEYVEVNERLRFFRETYPKFSLTSEVLEKTDNSILILASVIDEDGRVIANGMAEEEKGSTFINKTSYVENCETSAWGRALANFGIGLENSVASAEEVQNAVANSGAKPKSKELLALKVDDDNWVKVLKFVAQHKEKGLPWIADQLKVKYKPLTQKVKAELTKAIKS